MKFSSFAVFAGFMAAGVGLNSSTVFAFERKPFIILVAGGSASGKTHTAAKLVEALGTEKASLLSIDNYYAPQKQPQEFYKNGSINYDHPSAVDLKTLALHLQHLRAGFPVTTKEYTFARQVEVPTYVTVEPKDFIIVEGIFALYPDMLQLADFRIFVDAPVDTRFRRRLKRDQAERGNTEEWVRNYFESVVEPMHQQYVQPTALQADIVVESRDDEENTNVIVEAIRMKAQKTRATKIAVLTKTYNTALEELLQNSDDSYKLVSAENLFPTQPEAGYVHTSHKSKTVSTIAFNTSVGFDHPSEMLAYLKNNAIPVLEKDGKLFALDKHHLILALTKLGISRFYVQKIEMPHGFDPTSLELKNSAGQPLTFLDLVDNPYRTVASMVRDKGHIRKTGKFYEEFEWANFFKNAFEGGLKKPVTESVLLDADLRHQTVQKAIEFADSPEAKNLPGFLSTASPCIKSLE